MEIVSMVPHCREKRNVKPVRLDVLFDAVRSGRWSKQVMLIRQLIDLELPTGEEKGRLPAVLTSGKFRHASKAGFVGEHSGIICADFDHIDPCDVEEITEDLPWVAGWYVSPSGNGVKVFCRTNARTAEDHFPAWETVRRMFAEHGLEMDTHTKDISRLCYVSSDKSAILRPSDALQIDRSIKPVPEMEDLSDLDAGASSLTQARHKLRELGQAVEGQHGDFLTFKACNLGHDYGINISDWLHELNLWNQHNAPPWDERQLASKCASVYRNSKNPFGLYAMFAEFI